MSFYNVTNPTTFQVLDLVGRKGQFQQSALVRVDSTQIFSGATTLTAQQVIAGMISVNTSGGAITITLPAAAVLLAALNSGVYVSQPVSLNDIIYLTVAAFGAAGNAVTVASGSTVSTTTVTGQTSEQVGIRFTNVTAGSEAYTVLN